MLMYYWFCTISEWLRRSPGRMKAFQSSAIPERQGNRYVAVPGVDVTCRATPSTRCAATSSRRVVLP